MCSYCWEQPVKIFQDRQWCLQSTKTIYFHRNNCLTSVAFFLHTRLDSMPWLTSIFSEQRTSVEAGSKGKRLFVKNAINSHCSHPLMLGMSWPGKLITTQESIHDTEGSATLTAALISDSHDGVSVNVSPDKDKQRHPWLALNWKPPVRISFKAVSCYFGQRLIISWS